MKVLTGTALVYRSLEPEDAGAVWRACALRDPRPGLSVCREIVETQVDSDQDIADQLSLDGLKGTRRILALADGISVGMISIVVPAESSETAEVTIDPIEPLWAGVMEADARSWVRLLGVTNWKITVLDGGKPDPEPERLLIWIQ